MLPVSFVHATLVALDLPESLAERYAVPDSDPTPAEREEGDSASAPMLGRPPGAPAWPFPLH